MNHGLIFNTFCVHQTVRVGNVFKCPILEIKIAKTRIQQAQEATLLIACKTAEISKPGSQNVQFEKSGFGNNRDGQRRSGRNRLTPIVVREDFWPGNVARLHVGFEAGLFKQGRYVPVHSATARHLHPIGLQPGLPLEHVRIR